MPNRMIRESARTSSTLTLLSHGAERCFWRLTTVADDFGRFNSEPGVVRALCFPTMLKSVLERHVVGWLAEMRSVGLMRCYRVGEKHIGYFPSWGEHQYVRAKESKFPDPPTDVRVCCDVPTNTLEDVDVSEDVTTEDEDVVDISSPPANGPAASLAASWGKPEHLVSLYNRLAPNGHPRVTMLSPARRTKAKLYLSLFPDERFWVGVFTELDLSRFLQHGSKDHPNFKGDFDWLLTKGKDGSENAVKTYEGKFRDKEHA